MHSVLSHKADTPVCVMHSFLSENPEYEPCLFLSLGGRKKSNFELPGILAGGLSMRMGLIGRQRWSSKYRKQRHRATFCPYQFLYMLRLKQGLLVYLDNEGPSADKAGSVQGREGRSCIYVIHSATDEDKFTHQCCQRDRTRLEKARDVPRSKDGGAGFDITPLIHCSSGTAMVAVNSLASLASLKNSGSKARGCL